MPIGIVNASWGGTHIETWSGAHAVAYDPALAPLMARMPQDAASFKAARLKQQRAIIAAWQGPPRPADAQPNAGSDPQLDDRHWRTLTVPKAWEEQGLAGFDGHVWYRRGLCCLRAPRRAWALLIVAGLACSLLLCSSAEFLRPSRVTHPPLLTGRPT